MALFLPILRLLMLFLNVYESYKTLKPPLPSSRNKARPSVRAMTQRKRDMKGCLAVWIVWVKFCYLEFEILLIELYYTLGLPRIVRTCAGKSRFFVHSFLRRIQIPGAHVSYCYTRPGEYDITWLSAWL